jgi:O-succinylbenzoic acid--CoA ligase
MHAFVLNGTSYSRQQLLDGCPQVQVSDYERRVLDFCQHWLSGQETFTLQTSGSTGQPKTILLTRAQMVTSAQMMLVRGFELELRLTVIEPVSRPLALFTLAEHFDFTAMVPLQLHATLHGSVHERTILDGMKAVLIGGAPVSLALEEQLQRVQAPLYHTYGMTETVSHIALRRLNGPQRSDRFVPFAEVCLGVDTRGCLTITSALTRGEVLYTNDLVEFHTDGSLRWLGRIDNVINSGGVKVHIEQVERVLEAFLLHYQGGVYVERRFFVGPFPHPRLGHAVVAVLEGEPCSNDPTAASAFATALRTALQSALTPYAIPRQVFFVPQLLETRTGKIDRSATIQRLVAQYPAP